MRREQKLTVNLGLENNPIEVHEIIKSGGDLFYGEYSTKIVTSEYKGEPETTLVLEGITSYRLSKITNILEKWLVVYTQESIAFKYSNNSILLYGDYDGERFDFDNKFFKEL